MNLAIVVDTLADRVNAGLSGVAASDMRPTSVADLPVVAISVEDAARPLVGVGEFLGGPRTGSLEVTDTIDLAEPTLDFGDEVVVLVPPDRLTAIVAHGPIVDAETVSVSDGDGPYALVDGAPSGREVRIDTDAGLVEFGQPLPADGTLSVTYRIGMWDVATVRFSGELILETVAQDDEATALVSRSVAGLLAERDTTFARLMPLSWGVVTSTTVGGDLAHIQILRYRFDFELEQVALPTGGGVIDTVAVTSAADSAIETFDVTQQGSLV
jgi:hypothetical protein